MDKQYYIDNHIGLFKNFMSDELINDYVNYLISVSTRCVCIQGKKMRCSI